MKRGIIIGFLIMIMLVVSGCQGGIPGRGGGEPQETGYKTGSQGVEIRFMPNYPRPRVYDDETFYALIEVKNKGSYDVGVGGDTVYISGFDPTIITGIPITGKPIPQLEGIDQYNTAGEFETVEFEGQFYPLKEKNIDNYPATILATACYKYQTLGSENVCLDPDPFGTTSQRKVCTPGAVGFGTQGAPIAITSVDVEATPRVSRFKITVSNVGGGTVFKDTFDNLQRCSPYHTQGLEFNDVDVIKLSKVEIMGKTITSTCKPVTSEGYVRLNGGSATIFCELGGLGSGPAYTTPMSITLDYNYRKTISTRMDIIQTP